MKIRPYQPADAAAVVALWQECGLTRPWNDPHEDIRRKLGVRPEWFLVGIMDGELVATVMAGYEGHRGWLNYLAVAPAHRKGGLGRELVRAAEELLLQAGCPKVNLQIRSGNADVIEFYRRVGYQIDDVVSMGRRLIHDEPEAEG